MSEDPTREAGCNVAATLFGLAQEYGLVTPVWECPLFSLSKPPSSPVRYPPYLAREITPTDE